MTTTLDPVDELTRGLLGAGGAAVAARNQEIPMTITLLDRPAPITDATRRQFLAGSAALAVNAPGAVALHRRPRHHRRG